MYMVTFLYLFFVVLICFDLIAADGAIFLVGVDGAFPLHYFLCLDPTLEVGLSDIPPLEV